MTSLFTTEDERGLLGGVEDDGHRLRVYVQRHVRLSDGEAWNLLLQLRRKIPQPGQRSTKERLQRSVVQLPYPGYGL